MYLHCCLHPSNLIASPASPHFVVYSMVSCLYRYNMYSIFWSRILFGLNCGNTICLSPWSFRTLLVFEKISPLSLSVFDCVQICVLSFTLISWLHHASVASDARLSNCCDMLWSNLHARGLDRNMCEMNHCANCCFWIPRATSVSISINPHNVVGARPK
jgi:hypothetical protein